MRSIAALTITLLGLYGAVLHAPSAAGRTDGTSAHLLSSIVAAEADPVSSDGDVAGSIEPPGAALGVSEAPSVPAQFSVSSAGKSDRVYMLFSAPDQPMPNALAAEKDADRQPADSVDGLCGALLASAQDNDLPVAFFANLIWQESRLQRDSVSRAGALGIAQFMPDVAHEVGLADPFDPRQAIPASARFLRVLREHFGNLGYVAAAYNAGAHRVGEWLDHHRPLPQETRTYVLRVTGRSAETWQTAPPEDSQLTFARHLPCRALPAFAALTQAQDGATNDEASDTEGEDSTSHAHHTVLRKIAVRVAARLVQRIHGGHAAAHPSVAEHKEPRPAAARTVIARNFHTRHDAARRGPHAVHEKRRIAQQAVAGVTAA